MDYHHENLIDASKIIKKLASYSGFFMHYFYLKRYSINFKIMIESISKLKYSMQLLPTDCKINYDFISRDAQSVIF